jgi:hypothetical protein
MWHTVKLTSAVLREYEQSTTAVHSSALLRASTQTRVALLLVAAAGHYHWMLEHCNG